MNIQLSSFSKTSASDNILLIIDDKTKWKSIDIDEQHKKHLQAELDTDIKVSIISTGKKYVAACKVTLKGDENKDKEQGRRLGHRVNRELNKRKINEIHISNHSSNANVATALIEGLCLSNYQFTKYHTKSDSPVNALKKVKIDKDFLSKSEIDGLESILEATFLARDLVNEPLSYLTAPQLAKEIKKAGKEAGFKVNVMDKAEIIKNKMGGLLAVNLGSEDPPTFSIMEWKPSKATNKKPIVLVGKGVVYDTGGLSLKPTANSMDMMKCDMGGSAAVIGAMYAVSKAKLPLHVIGLVPSTDNRPGKNAYVPGDVITMHNKMTVEVLNTDAEGRMLLADALSYAQKYKPELVIDLATLTGAAARAIGSQGSVMVGTADEKEKNELKESGFNVHERIAEFPFWDEYGDMIKSDVADIKNIGGAYAGAITAGKFLEHFTDYPWMHIDIAGAAYLLSENTYKGKYGTGVGVRLIFDFLKNKCA